MSHNMLYANTVIVMQMLSNGSEPRHKEIYLNQTEACFDDDKKGTKVHSIYIIHCLFFSSPFKTIFSVSQFLHSISADLSHTQTFINFPHTSQHRAFWLAGFVWQGESQSDGFNLNYYSIESKPFRMDHCSPLSTLHYPIMHCGLACTFSSVQQIVYEPDI